MRPWDFLIGEALGFKATLHGEMVALKSDLWQHPDYEKELLNRAAVYHALKDLLDGYTAGGLFAIATDIGRPLGDCCGKLK